MLTLGTAPEQLSVVLARGGAFHAELVNLDGAWAATDEVELRFPLTAPVVWAAQRDAAVMRFARSAAAVTALLDAQQGYRAVQLWYIADGLDVLWAAGSVHVA